MTPAADERAAKWKKLELDHQSAAQLRARIASEKSQGPEIKKFLGQRAGLLATTHGCC
jgi:hypothetical protein